MCVGVAIGISLLPYKEAEIMRYFISFFGNGGHLWFTTYPRRWSVHTSSAVLFDSEIVGVAFEISLPSCEQTDKDVFQVHRPPSWIFHFRLHLAVSLVVLLKWPLRKWGVAVEIMSLSCTAAEISLGSFSPPPHSNVRTYECKKGLATQRLMHI